MDVFNDLITRFQKSILNDINQMTQNNIGSQFYAVALLCDDELTNFFIALATKERLNQIIEDEDILDDQEDILYYQWSPNEWTLTSDDLPRSLVKELNREIYNIYEKYSNNNNFLEFKKRMFDTSIKVLSNIQTEIRELVKEPEIPIFLSFTDASKLEEIQNYSSSHINPNNIHQKFKSRFNSLEWGKDLGELNPFL